MVNLPASTSGSLGLGWAQGKGAVEGAGVELGGTLRAAKVNLPFYCSCFLPACEPQT